MPRFLNCKWCDVACNYLFIIYVLFLCTLYFLTFPYYFYKSKGLLYIFLFWMIFYDLVGSIFLLLLHFVKCSFNDSHILDLLNKFPPTKLYVSPYKLSVVQYMYSGECPCLQKSKVSTCHFPVSSNWCLLFCFRSELLHRIP